MIQLIEIREATLSDVEGITGVHKSDVNKWYKVIDSDLVEASYEELSIEERWLHGGPWMSKETCYMHLKSFMNMGGKVLVAVNKGQIIGEIEFISDSEPFPYLDNIEIYVLMIHNKFRGRGVGRKLMESVENYCSELKASSILVSSEERSINFYKKINYSLFEEYETLSIKLDKLPRISEVHFEPINKISTRDTENKLLLMGRFHNTKATMYNLSFSYPFRRMINKYFYYKLYVNDSEHFLVIRKSNMINNSLYCWVDTSTTELNTISRILINSLQIARSLGIEEILVALRKDLIKFIKKLNLKYSNVEKIPWFKKECKGA